MKTSLKIAIAFIIGLLIAGLFYWANSKSTSIEYPTSVVDTTMYTDVVLKNCSQKDVTVYVTLQSGESIIGKFGMDSSNIDKDQGLCEYINGKDTLKIPCHGKFLLPAGKDIHLGYSKPLFGAIITFGAKNKQCSAAQKDGWINGINNFEFTVNSWYQNGKVYGGNESFDITLVDGLHSFLRQSVTSFGPRVDTTELPKNFGCYWDFGAKDNNDNFITFTSSKNGPTFKSNQNIPGVYPYGCDLCYMSVNPPTPICFDIYPSTKWGNVGICQTNRPGQGGQVICEFLGFIGEPQLNK